jgi:hypothetical protein
LDKGARLFGLMVTATSGCRAREQYCRDKMGFCVHGENGVGCPESVMGDNIMWQFMKISYDVGIIASYVNKHGCQARGSFNVHGIAGD